MGGSGCAPLVLGHVEGLGSQQAGSGGQQSVCLLATASPVPSAGGARQPLYEILAFSSTAACAAITAAASVAARDPRYQLYLELPTSLRKRIIQQRQESALAELGFYPDGMTPMQRQQAGRMLAAASSPVRLAAGQQLFEAVLEFKAADRDDLDWSGPSYFILDEGEGRVWLAGWLTVWLGAGRVAGWSAGLCMRRHW